ncbi:MAG: rod shape-determining protein MreD [Proteobacteria bacterium]|nr:rod shape-determining protein MreD [Pseudomonadota bacterium]
MAAKSNKNQRLLMHFSLLLGILFSLIPWSGLVDTAQPYWLALLIIYWSLTKSDSRMMNMAFIYGLLLDLLYGSLMGLHGFSLVALSYLMTKFAKRLKMTSTIQLMMMVAALLVNDILIRGLINWISYRQTPNWYDLIPVVSAVLVWPWLKYILDRLNVSLRNL